MILVLTDNTAKISQNISDLVHQICLLLVQVLTAATTPRNGSGAASAAVQDSHACNSEPFDRDLGKCRGLSRQYCVDSSC